MNNTMNQREIIEGLSLYIKEYLAKYLFELNDLYTRTAIRNSLRIIFEAVRWDLGFYDWCIVCDESNNTPVTIDSHELHVDIVIMYSDQTYYLPVQICNGT